LRQRAIASLAFGAIALIALLGLGTDPRKGVYVLIFSAAVGIAAFVIGITALLKARKSGSYRPRFAVGGIVLGAFATLISVSILAVYLSYPTQVKTYINCLHQAETSSDQQACMTKFYKSVHLGATSATSPTRKA
jgi:formate-dependent nitrite reductase membrane component NrfD